MLFQLVILYIKIIILNNSNINTLLIPLQIYEKLITFYS